jgi:hypothetical protein
MYIFYVSFQNYILDVYIRLIKLSIKKINQSVTKIMHIETS